MTVTVVGDIMLGRRVAEAAAAVGGPAVPLRVMAERLARADVTVGNLESTLSQAGAPRQGDDSFAAPPSVLRGLTRAGFDVLGLANNHTGDFGRLALRRTVHAFNGSPHRAVGAGADRREAWRPAVVERRGVRIGFLAFNAIGETWRAGPHSAGAASLHMQPRTGAIVPAELQRLPGRVRRLAARTDVTIVLPHWGDQYTHQPVPDQRRVGCAAAPRRRHRRRGWAPALGAGGAAGAGPLRRALAGQLRLRHGLHAADPGGVRPRPDRSGPGGWWRRGRPRT